MTSLLSRSSSLYGSRWRRWFRAWGSDERVTNDPAASAGNRPVKGGSDIPVIPDGCSHLARSRGCRHFAGSTTSRTGRAAIAVFAHIAPSLLKTRRPWFINSPNKAPATAPFPLGDGRSFPEAQISCSTRMARLRDGKRPCRTTSGPRLSMSQWPNSTSARDSSETTPLSITPAQADTSGTRKEV